MMPRRRRPPRPCITPGCSGRSTARAGLCRGCWYQLLPGARLTIAEAFWLRFFPQGHALAADVAEQLGRRAANEREAAPAVALCTRCERSTSDPVVGSCSDVRCPHAVQVAA
jgi:hypothetical protein